MLAVRWPGGITASHSVQLVVAIGTPLAKFAGMVFCTKYCG